MNETEADAAAAAAQRQHKMGQIYANSWRARKGERKGVPLAGNAANCTRCLLQLLQRTTHNVATGNREVKMKYYKHFYTIR